MNISRKRPTLSISDSDQNQQIGSKIPPSPVHRLNRRLLRKSTEIRMHLTRIIFHPKMMKGTIFDKWTRLQITKGDLQNF